MSMSNLNHRSLDRVIRDDTNLSTISSGSVTSISSLGKKKRAPAPPSKKPSVTQVSIPEETPSMVHFENHSNNEIEHLPVPKPGNFVFPILRQIDFTYFFHYLQN